MKQTPSPLEQEILDLCRQGKKLSAIKLYKKNTGSGLKESNDYVSQLVKANQIVMPEKTDACFIATACYGNYNAPEVLALRQFRDEKLLKTNIGKMFVGFYYVISPPLAAIIAKSGVLKTLIQRYFLAPIVAKLQQQTNNKITTKPKRLGLNKRLCS